MGLRQRRDGESWERRFRDGMTAKVWPGMTRGRRGTRSATPAGIAAGAAILLLTAACASQAPVSNALDCEKVGTWLDPGTGETIAPDRLLARLAERPVVLLGEVHDKAEHHRWQLHTLAALYGHRPDLVVGFEMFPRRVQAALDHWVDGRLDVEAFLKSAEWWNVWGIEPALYLPLFHFARQNRVPMIALNVEHELIARVRHEGWAAIPADERAGLSDPAPASRAYREALARVFAEKQARLAIKEGEGHEEETAASAGHGEADIVSVMQSKDFARFVEAQLTWDRAMAEALAEARRRAPEVLVVAVMGRGHVEYGHGVPHQLADLGIPDAAVLLPVEAATACHGLPPDLADAVFVVEAEGRIEKGAPRPRLGVMLEAAEDGVRIVEVLEGGVAEASALAPDDVVVSAAGVPIERVSDLIEIVQRQAPGTWLPLTIRRNGERLELVAKFPTRFETSE